MRSKAKNEIMLLFMQLPDFLRQQAVRGMKRHALPTPCATDVVEILREAKSLDSIAHGDLIRECEEICRKSDAYRAKIMRTHDRNKRMILVATGLSPPL